MVTESPMVSDWDWALQAELQGVLEPVQRANPGPRPKARGQIVVALTTKRPTINARPVSVR